MRHRFNTQILVERDGSVVARYRKVHLPGHEEHEPDRPFQHAERYFFEPGPDGFGVWRAFGGLVGMMICNDRRWPESYRVMGLQGVELILCGYNTPIHYAPDPSQDILQGFHNALVMQSGAYQNGTWVVGVAKGGVEEGVDSLAQSMIVAPSGQIVAQALTAGDELVVARCDLDWCARYQGTRVRLRPLPPPRDVHPDHVPARRDPPRVDCRATARSAVARQIATAGSVPWRHEGRHVEVDRALLAERARLGLDDETRCGTESCTWCRRRTGSHQRFGTDLLARARAARGAAWTADVVRDRVLPGRRRLPGAGLGRLPPRPGEHRGIEGAELVIEIRSPGDESIAKIPWYLAQGCGEVLIVDRDTLAVELHAAAGDGRLRRATCSAARSRPSTVLQSASRWTTARRSSVTARSSASSCGRNDV